MQISHAVPIAAVLLAMTAVAGAETLRFDTQILEVEPLLADDFASIDAWETSGEAAAEEGRLIVERDGTAASHESIERPHLITFTARVQPGGEAAAFFCVSDEGPEAGSYAVRFTPAELRLIEMPGGTLVDHNESLGTTAVSEFDVAIMKFDRRIRVFVDDRLALDYWDLGESGIAEPALPGGHVLFSATGRMAVEDFAVRRITRREVAMIDQLKDLHLQTDLRAATIVTGASEAHQQAAERIEAAIEQRTGADVAISSDADLPDDGAVIALGNFADNPLIERLYNEWYTIVDRRFPGEAGHYLQTIHDPLGGGQNVVVVGASDDEGLARAADEFIAHIPESGVIGRLYEVAASDEYMALTEWDYGERLIIPAGWPLHFALADYGSRDDPRHSGIVYLVTGDDAWAERYREQMLRWIEKGIIGHLHVPGWMEIWDLMEEHPAFSDEERLAITNFFLTQVRSDECIGALHIQRWPWGMPHQNHGTRPGVGTFFMARYFRHGYDLPEMDVYLGRISDYFGMQDSWSKPMCDSSMHQWEATLEDKAIYALASGETGFFESGAARRAAERALRTMYNAGMLPTIGDAHYASGPYTLLAKCAYYYEDGRYLWPSTRRPDEPRANTDELLRTYIGDIAPEPPEDIVGLSVLPYDRGFWQGWRNLPSPRFFNPPTIEYEQAFDKIAMRTGLDLADEFLLLDGMVGASHDYDDTNTIHLYSRNGREYLVTYDGLFEATIAWHNGVNIIRDGLSTAIPYFAERLHSVDLGDVMISQTRLNDFAQADWTRSVLMAPERYFVVIDAMTAREPGTFTFSGHWKTLGEPQFSADTLTVAQWPLDDGRTEENTTYFHMQTPAERVSHERLEYLTHGRGARYYPFAEPRPNRVTHSSSSTLAAGETDFLATLAHETGAAPDARFRMHSLGQGVVRIDGPGVPAWAGAPRGEVRIGEIVIDADAFHLTPETLVVAGGRRAVIGGVEVLADEESVTEALALDAALGEQLRALLASSAHDIAAGAGEEASSDAELERAWQYDAGGEVSYLRAHLGNPGADVLAPDRQPLPGGLGAVAVPSEAGRVALIEADGSELARAEAGVAVHDVCIADIDDDGSTEMLLARADSTLECRNPDGSTRWLYQPETRQATNTALFIRSNPALYTFVVDGPGGEKTVCVATGDQRLHGLTPDGEPKWTFWSYAGLFGVHGLYDVDGDGVAEIVGGNPEVSSTDALYFLKQEGLSNGRGGDDRYLRRVLNDGWGSTLSSMAIADINDDGRDEIAFGTGRASLYAAAPTMEDDGRLFHHRLGDDVRGTEIIHDADGTALVVTGSSSEFVTAFDASGAKRWSAAVGGPVAEMTSAVAESGEVVVAALAGGEVLVLTADGEVAGRARIDARPTALTVTASDRPLIVVADEAGAVTAFELQRGG
ncbi:MAG: hypothetical protein ACLFU7_00105 [Armatimonadota bacterium]